MGNKLERLRATKVPNENDGQETFKCIKKGFFSAVVLPS